MGIRAAWTLVAFSLLLGCGYRFTAGGAELPGGVKEVCAPLFVNRTAEPGLELAFTQSFRSQLIRVGRLASTCNANVKGELVNVWGGPTVFTSTGNQLASYRVFATVHVQLVQADKVLADATVTGAEDYLPSLETAQDVLQVEANRQAALRRLSETLARDAYEKLTTAW
jgi:hypothetical protein